MVEGDEITPNLRLVRPLGRGASSHVWSAHDSKAGRDVVVKVLGKPLARHSPQFHRFQREAEVAGHIKSAHVAQVLGHGVSTAGLPYLEMELLEGENLATRLAREGQMSLLDVARLVSQLARGLGKAHMMGLVHRNLKPTNVFLATASEADGSFEVKVLDVGLSSGLDLAVGGRIPTEAPADMAPPEYASPEQVFGVKEVDFRSDLWAIAVVAYHALTGRPPFRAPTADAFARAIEDGAFDPPSRIVHSVPAAVDAWFVKALQRDPAARFGGARELADEFARAAGIDTHERLTRPSLQPPMTTTQRFARPGTDTLSRAAGIAAKDALATSQTRRKDSLSSSVVLIALLAIVGLGTVIAGLTLLHR